MINLILASEGNTGGTNIFSMIMFGLILVFLISMTWIVFSKVLPKLEYRKKLELELIEEQLKQIKDKDKDKDKE